MKASSLLSLRSPLHFSLFHTHSLSLTLAFTLFLSHSPSLSHSHSLSLSLSFSLCLSHFPLPLMLTFALSLPLTLTASLSASAPPSPRSTYHTRTVESTISLWLDPPARNLDCQFSIARSSSFPIDLVSSRKRPLPPLILQMNLTPTP